MIPVIVTPQTNTFQNFMGLQKQAFQNGDKISESDVTDFKLSANSIMLTINIGFKFFK